MAEPASGFDALASLVEKLAVLLAAGVAPAAAWGYLVDDRDDALSERVREAAHALGEGRSIPRSEVSDTAGLASRGSRARAAGGATDDVAWRGLAAAWQIATEAGAPLAPTLQRFAASLRDLADNERDARTALAGPVATTRMVMVLPLVGIFFGVALGFDTLATLFTTPPGLACLALGVTLILVARWWSARLVRGARPASVVPGLALDLIAIAVSGGASISRALRSVEDARTDFGLAADDSAAIVEQTFELSARAGVPAASLLRSAADEARRTARSLGQRNAATLSVTLMLPLGLCILPAFMLLGVAPLLISVISSTVGSL
jgi:tight adherence protein B